MAHIRLIPGFSGKEARTGVCYVSGQPQLKVDGEREPVVDLDTEILHEGNLEITLTTAREIASVIGYISPEANGNTAAENIALKEEVRELRQRLEDQKVATGLLASEVAATAHERVSA